MMLLDQSQALIRSRSPRAGGTEELAAVGRQIANQAGSRGVFESNRLNERLNDILAGGYPANNVGTPLAKIHSVVADP
jgi:hypothetical protein